MIGVVLVGGVLFGIILDEFAKVRDEKKEVQELQENYCFICNHERLKFDQEPGAGFARHIGSVAGTVPGSVTDGDHNMWQYLFFIIHLSDLDPTDYNGPEYYVASKVIGFPGNPGYPFADPKIEWIPNMEAIVLSSAEDERSEDDKTADIIATNVTKLKSDLTKMRRDYEIIGDDLLNDLSKKLKGLEDKP